MLCSRNSQMTKHKNSQQAGETKHPILSGIHIHVESLLKTPHSVCTHNNLGNAEWISMHRIIRKY